MIPYDPFRPSGSPGGFLPPLAKVVSRGGRSVSIHSTGRPDERRLGASPAAPPTVALPPVADPDRAIERLADRAQPQLPAEPDVDVFGKVVRTPPETVRVARRTSRSEKRLSRESGPGGALFMVTSPPPLGPLPPPPPGSATPPVSAALTATTAVYGSPSSATRRGRESAVLPRETAAPAQAQEPPSAAVAHAPSSSAITGGGHKRTESGVSTQSTSSAKGTYFADYTPVPSTLLAAPLAAAPAQPEGRRRNSPPDAAAHEDDVQSALSAQAPAPAPASVPPALPLAAPPKPRPLTQDTRRRSVAVGGGPGAGARRVPARPETADDPCLVLSDTSYQRRPSAGGVPPHPPSALRA